jgi:hypothetical protein
MSTIEIQRCIIHNLQKKLKETEANFDPSESLVTLDKDTKNHLEVLVNTFKKHKNKMYALFLKHNDKELPTDISVTAASGSVDGDVVKDPVDGSAENTEESDELIDEIVTPVHTADISFFQTEFDKYINDADDTSSRDSIFLDFSKHIGTKWTEMINANPRVSNIRGGYLLFIEINDEKPYFLLFLVREKQEGKYEKDATTKSYNVTPLISADIDAPVFGCRIDENTYRQYDTAITKSEYLSFIKISRTKISQFFINWFSAVPADDDKAFSNRFIYKVLNEIHGSEDPDNKKKTLIPTDPKNRKKTLSKGEFIGAAKDYIAQHRDFDVTSFSKEFFGKETKIPKLVEKKGLNINNNFVIPDDVLRSLTQYRVEADSILLRFPEGYIRKGKVSLRPNGTDVVITSKEFYKALKREKDSRNN